MPGFGWEIFAAIGAVVITIALAYGLVQFNRRNRANDPLRELATREQYQNPERYEERTKPAIDRQIDRS